MAKRLAKRFVSREDFAKAPTSGLGLRKVYQPEISPIDETRSLRFTISTDGIDRDNDMIAAAGWDLSNYQKNPVVLWAHQYDQLPVGKATNLRVEHGKLVADAEFVSGEIYPFAETVYRMLKAGFLGSTSVGFKPKEFAFNEKRQGFDFATQELLEFSVVPIPANPDALLDARAAGILDEADVEAYAKWATDALTVTKGAGAWRVLRVPGTAVVALASALTAWATPSLADFTDKAWDALSEDERARVADHFGWAQEYPPVAFDHLKFPHHDPATGEVNLRAVLDGLKNLANDTHGLPEAEALGVAKHLGQHIGLTVKALPKATETDVWVALFPRLAKDMPTPDGAEDEQTFVSRCLGDTAMSSEYPDEKQRAAVCYAQYRRSRKTVKAMDGCTRGEACPMTPEMEYCPDADCPMGRAMPEAPKAESTAVTKIGRVLAARNEARLRQAATLLTEVLGELELAPVEEPKTAKTAPDPEVVFMLDDEPAEPVTTNGNADEIPLGELDPQALRELIGRSVDAAYDAYQKNHMTRTTGELD